MTRRHRIFLLVVGTSGALIAGILALVLLPSFLAPKETICRFLPPGGFAETRQALVVFEIDNGQLPTTAEGLDALIHQPPTLTSWHGPYVEKLPVDRWGRDYLYKVPGTAGKAFDLISAGPDGKFGTADDVAEDPP